MIYYAKLNSSKLDGYYKINSSIHANMYILL